MQSQFCLVGSHQNFPPLSRIFGRRGPTWGRSRVNIQMRCSTCIDAFWSGIPEDNETNTAELKIRDEEREMGEKERERNCGMSQKNESHVP